MTTDQEKRLDDKPMSRPSTLHGSPHPSDVEKEDIELNQVSNTQSKLALSEDEALVRARANPQESLPIYLTFAPDDKDSPRNWPKWRRWYITCFVSMLNVVTYVEKTPLKDWALFMLMVLKMPMRRQYIFGCNRNTETIPCLR